MKLVSPGTAKKLLLRPADSSFGTHAPCGVVRAFWKRRPWREPDGGSLHARFDGGEGSRGTWSFGLSFRAFLSTLLVSICIVAPGLLAEEANWHSTGLIRRVSQRRTLRLRACPESGRMGFGGAKSRQSLVVVHDAREMQPNPNPSNL